MNEFVKITLAGLAGLGLGTFFFYGLWLTVRKTLTTSRPALWMLSSFMIRMGITVAGFFYVGNGNWQRLVVCLLGFVIARYMVTYLTRSAEAQQQPVDKSISHAS
ncbi:ATP synthase subunit I [Spirosoma spitsbergense]|uniref:ATP synthase subunit I n=1 Tax=Spirosoma spitsbergense TaxID=431554 RepID=UPI00036EAF30|nr:ATP synthase subunit I [Spirosoma spitsbergense]